MENHRTYLKSLIIGTVKAKQAILKDKSSVEELKAIVACFKFFKDCELSGTEEKQLLKCQKFISKRNLDEDILTLKNYFVRNSRLVGIVVCFSLLKHT